MALAGSDVNQIEEEKEEKDDPPEKCKIKIYLVCTCKVNLI